jgi:hypothetical protein
MEAITNQDPGGAIRDQLMVSLIRLLLNRLLQRSFSSGFFVKPEISHRLSMFLKSFKLSKNALEPPPAM